MDERNDICEEACQCAVTFKRVYKVVAYGVLCMCVCAKKSIKEGIYE